MKYEIEWVEHHTGYVNAENKEEAKAIFETGDYHDDLFRFDLEIKSIKGCDANE